MAGPQNRATHIVSLGKRREVGAPPCHLGHVDLAVVADVDLAVVVLRLLGVVAVGFGIVVGLVRALVFLVFFHFNEVAKCGVV